MKKKKFTKKVTGVFFRVINIRKWSDWDRTKSLSLALKDGIKRLFVPQKHKTDESFRAAQKRMHLSEEDLLVKQKALFRLSMLMLGIAFALFAYAGYQVFYGSYKAVILSLVVLSIALVLAFRYHFWYFQIKHHKLGCTFEQWYKQGLWGGKR